MKQLFAVGLMALSLSAGARDAGPFRDEAPEPIEASTKAGATCSLWARYDPQHVVWQEQHFLGGFTQCGDWDAWYAAASAAAVGLPAWDSYGFAKDGAPPGPTTGDTPYQCSVNINFDATTPSKVQVVFTGASACTAQRNRVLAVVKGSMACNIFVEPCPWSNP